MPERTQLMRAVANDDLTYLFDLMASDSNIDIFAKDEKGRTALDWARICKNELAIAVLSKAMEQKIKETRIEMVANSGVEVRLRETNERQKHLLMAALVKKDSNGILSIIRENRLFRDVIELSGQTFFLDIEAESGDTPLIFAAMNNDVPLLEALITAGSLLDYQNRFGHTALSWASICGHSDIVRELLHRGADIFHRSKEGRTALHYACLYAKSAVVSRLLDILFIKFSDYRDKHPVTKADPTRWTKYASIMEEFLEVHTYVNF